jgi:transcriptional regulator with XRE-family HTH domain
MLGKELRLARKKAGLTQEELAARASITREYVSMLENDRKSPTFDLLSRVCWAMGASVGALATKAEEGMRKGSRRSAP